MTSVTFLGPLGATFSHDSYVNLANTYRAPHLTEDASNYQEANSNEEILGKIIAHGGYGCIAMQTQVAGRINGSLDTFIDLLSIYPSNSTCPLQIIGAQKRKIHFCLMTKNERDRGEIKSIITHPKSIDACKKNIANLNVPTLEVKSNGDAARKIAQDPKYAQSAAIGPLSASAQYGLHVIDDQFEDKEALTTFHLIGPRDAEVAPIASQGRMLIIFDLKNEKGSLVRALEVLQNANLSHIHSIHIRDDLYRFATEISLHKDEVDDMRAAVEVFKKQTVNCLSFGPFPIHTA